MAKTKNISELTNILAVALRHKIGNIVNENEIYAQKYAKDAEVLINQAQKISFRENWNSSDKEKIKNKLKKKLRDELEKRDLLDKRKFDIMGDEMNKVLVVLGLKD